MRAGMAAVCGLCFIASCVGDAGADGRDGQDGAVLTSMDLPVGSSQCPAGGILVAVDGAARALCNGEDGQAGAMGAAGATGPAGASGAPGQDGEAVGYRPVSLMSCSAAVDFYGEDAIEETYLKHDAVIYSNGDAEISCEVAGGTDSGSGSGYFPGGTVGATSLKCSAAVDYPPGGDGTAGFMDFALSATGPVAIYRDTPNPLNGEHRVLGPSDCIVRKWSGAAWVAGSFADL